MTRDHDDILEPQIEPAERAELERTADLLKAERPVPRPAFRGELRRRLVADTGRPAPARLRLLIAAYAGSGALLLLVAALGVAGAGPLAA